MAKRNRTGLVPIDARSIRKFLRVIGEGWSVGKASKLTGISHHRWGREAARNSHFKKRWDRASELGVHTLEDAAHKRAVRGVLEPKISNGRIVTYVRTYSDGLLSKALAARSKTYAAASPGDSAFEDTFIGEAEGLFTSLHGLFQKMGCPDLPSDDPRVGSFPQR